MRLACIAAALCLGGVFSVGLTGSAQADSAPQLEVKVGNGAWTSSPPPMFDIRHLEPGSTISSEVRVRDVGAGAGSLSLQASDVVEITGVIGVSRPFTCGAADGLADHLMINLAQRRDGTLSTLFSGNLCALEARSAELTSTPLQPGAEAAYVVAAYLPKGVGNQEQGASASWSLAWRITSDSGDSSAVVTRVLGEKATRGGSHGLLAFTGFDAMSWAAAGLLSALFGLFLLLVRTNRRWPTVIGRN